MPDDRGFSIRNSGGDAPTRIDIFSDIDPYFGVSAEAFLAELKMIRTDEIELHINSGGGEVFDGIAIMNSLKDHPARVTVVVDGLAASAASFIAVGGADHLVMQESATLMIHEAWTLAMGDSQAIEKTAAELDRVSGIIAGIYAKKAGTPVEEWRAAMRDESWFTAEEAMLVGLIDEIRISPTAPVANAVPKSRVLNSGSFKYRSREQAPTPEIAARAKAQETSSALAEDNRKESSMADLMNELRQRLGVADADADEGTVLAALDEALSEQVAGEGHAMSAEAVAAALEEGVIAAEEMEKILSEASGTTHVEPDEETVVLDKEVYADLLARAEKGDEFDEKTTREAAEEFVQNAIDAGKLSAASKDRWVTRVLGDPEDAKARINQMASGRVPREELGRGGSDNEASDNLSAAADRSGFATRPKL